MTLKRKASPDPAFVCGFCGGPGHERCPSACLSHQEDAHWTVQLEIDTLQPGLEPQSLIAIAEQEEKMDGEDGRTAFSEEEMDGMADEEAWVDDAIAEQEEKAWVDDAIAKDQEAIQAAIEPKLEPQPAPSLDERSTNPYYQQPGELQAACAGESGSPDVDWDLFLPPDRAAAIRRLAVSTFL